MPWTANITKVTKNKLDFEILVDFTKGTETNTIKFVLSEPASIKQVLQRQIDAYERIENLNIQTGLVDFTPIVIEPTPEEIAKREYDQKRGELSALKQDLDLKLIDQAVYDAKVSEVIAIKPVEIAVDAIVTP